MHNFQRLISKILNNETHFSIQLDWPKHKPHLLAEKNKIW